MLAAELYESLERMWQRTNEDLGLPDGAYDPTTGKFVEWPSTQVTIKGCDQERLVIGAHMVSMLLNNIPILLETYRELRARAETP